MFQIDNIDKETGWNLNGTRIIIPLVDGDPLPKEPDKIVRTVNLTSEDGNQNSPTGNQEDNLVLSVDKNLFEPQSTKTDLLIIQDSDLKLLSYNPDLKNQLGFLPLLVNQDRSETLWENPGLKDKPKDWSQDNAILEVKDILIYDEKANEKGESKSFVTKSREDTQREEGAGEAKNEKNFQLIINYIPKCYGISSKRDGENYEILMGNVESNGNENATNDGGDDAIFHKGNTDEMFSAEQKNALPEKSLPLKKKAKMKKTVICYENQRSLLKQELTKNRQLPEESQPAFFNCENKELQSSIQQEGSDVINSKKLNNKRKKTQKTASNLQVLKSKTEPARFDRESAGADLLKFDITKFKNIYDLVEGLRKYRMISVAVWQLLNAGLKEMNVDILKEIIKRRNESKGGNFSPQLKAFALVVYFKQPAAFNFLAKVCKDGWPSLSVIKEWKLKLNNHQRPNFVGVERKTENEAS